MGKGRRFDPEAEAKGELKKQRKAFIKTFGRKPGPGDPVFFDPGADVPRALPPKTLEDDLLDVFRAAGTPPEIVCAFMKTDLLHTEANRERYPPDAIEEWDAAIEEYFRLEDEKREA